MALSAKAADELFEKATKLTQPNVIALRLRPDWEQATPLFEKAAIAYKVGYSFKSTLARLVSAEISRGSYELCLWEDWQPAVSQHKSTGFADLGGGSILQSPF